MIMTIMIIMITVMIIMIIIIIIITIIYIYIYYRERERDVVVRCWPPQGVQERRPERLLRLGEPAGGLLKSPHGYPLGR